MKKIVVLTLLLVLLCPDVFAVEPKVKKNRFFDAIKEYASKDLALNDVLEFSYFDMGETSLINDTTDEGLSPPTQDLDSENTDEAVAVPPTDVLSSQQEIKKAIDQLPKLFYVSLKNHIERQRVPVNLYSGEGPGYTNPLKLYIKVKRIHLLPQVTTKQGAREQPIELRIFGQIKEKKTDQILVKFYDATTSSFTLGEDEAERALKNLSQSLMGDLAQYLKTYY